MTFILSIISTFCYASVGIIFAQTPPSQSDARITQEEWTLWEYMPKQLTINVNYPSGEIIELMWKMNHHYLANEHLPVVVPFDTIEPNMKEDIGNFVVYHDIEKSSAVVYYAKFDALFGVIGMNYYIYNLPFRFNNEGIYELGTVGEPYLMKYESPLPHIFPIISNMPFFRRNSGKANSSLANHDLTHDSKKRPTDFCPDVGPSIKRSCSNEENNKIMANKPFGVEFDILYNLEKRQHYLEILVFVLNDIVNIFKLYYGENEYIQWIIRYYIVYFNSIDMFLRKLERKNVLLHVNIAKIVIEDDLLPFGFTRNNELHFVDVIQKVPKYLSEHELEFPRDSFDCIFIHTSKPIFDTTGKVNGITRSGMNLYEARKNDQFYEVVPISVVTFNNWQANYIVALQQIGQILGFGVDSPNDGITVTGQCCSIMQKEGAKCSNCLQWTNKNILEYHEFFRTNLNRCFMLNPPRSLQPLGITRFLTPHRQCLCFGFDSYMINYSSRPAKMIKATECGKHMKCLHEVDGVKQYSPTVSPFDGTPCMTKKVCWAGKCVHVTNE